MSVTVTPILSREERGRATIATTSDAEYAFGIPVTLIGEASDIEVRAEHPYCLTGLTRVALRTPSRAMLDPVRADLRLIATIAWGSGFD